MSCQRLDNESKSLRSRTACAIAQGGCEWRDVSGPLLDEAPDHLAQVSHAANPCGRVARIHDRKGRARAGHARPATIHIRVARRSRSRSFCVTKCATAESDIARANV